MIENLTEVAFPRWTIEENTGTGPLKVTGLASVTGVPNRNNRIYPTEAMRREVARMNEDLHHSNRVGLVDHPTQGESSISDMGLKFTKLWMEANEILFEAEIIPTQRGRDLEAIIKAGVNVGISSRAYATVKPVTYEGKTYSMVQDDLDLISFDAVIDPSVSTAAIRTFEEKSEAVPTYIHEALERLLVPVSSVELDKEITGDTMKTEDLIMRVEAQGDIPEELTVEEAVVVGTTEVEETPVIVEETPEVTTEIPALVAAVNEAAPVVETEEVIPPVETPEVTVVERVVESPELTERATLAEQRIQVLESEMLTLREDANIQLAILALVNAIKAELDEGDYDTVAALAGCAQHLDFANMLDDMSEGEGESAMESLKHVRGFTEARKVLAPFGVAATRILRDKAAFEMTKDELYGRRMLNIFMESADTAEAVKDTFDMVKARVVMEATGKHVVPEIRGQILTGREDMQPQLTEEQLEMRRLAFGPNRK